MNSSNKVPVLLLTFNRPDTTKKVFDAIRMMQPLQLFIAQDGPRNEKEKSKIENVRAVFAIDRPCSVQYLMRDHNVGCRDAVVEAITWFFESVEFGMILEDDCVPNPSFMEFCATVLYRYQHQDDIMVISWSNYQQVTETNFPYFYGYHAPILWWWASRRRAWQHYTKHPQIISTLQRWLRPSTGNRLYDRALRKYMQGGYRDSNRYAVVYANRWKVITPSVNLITNIWTTWIHNDRPGEHHNLKTIDITAKYDIARQEYDLVENKAYDTYIKKYLTKLMIFSVLERMFIILWIRKPIKYVINRFYRFYYRNNM